MIGHGDFRVLQSMKFLKESYRPFGPAAVQVSDGIAIKTSLSLARSLKDLGYERWAKEVVQFVRHCASGKSTLLCRWSCAFKTHKADGDVCLCSIHSIVGHLHNVFSETINR